MDSGVQTWALENLKLPALVSTGKGMSTREKDCQEYKFFYFRSIFGLWCPNVGTEKFLALISGKYRERYDYETKRLPRIQIYPIFGQFSALGVLMWALPTLQVSSIRRIEIRKKYNFFYNKNTYLLTTHIP